MLDLVLGIVKIIVGFVSHSQALVADGVHSFSDLATDLLVIAAARHATQGPDQEHPYGHGRIQTAASVFLALSLVAVALGIVWDSLARLQNVDGNLQPGYWALVVAAVSALLKEAIYRYTARSARRLDSKLLEVNAWHSRSDAFSSLVVIAGTGGAIAGFPWADPAAAIMVAGLIIHIAWKIGREGFNELIDTGVSPDLAKQIEFLIMQVDGVREMHQLRTRKMGSEILADVHIHVGPRISVSEGHRIGDAVTERLEQGTPGLRDVTVHIDPEDDDQKQPSINLPLRPKIVDAVKNAFEELQNTGFISQTESPLNIVLHYLEGKLSVEIWLSLTNESSTALAREIGATVSRQLQQSAWMAEVTVLFVPRDL
jgi:cation diffusion facilitator family transporter